MKHLAAVLLAILGIALVATTAAADESIPSSSPWGGSNVARPAPITSPIVQLTIKGRIQNGSDLRYTEPVVAVTFDDNPDTGCALAPAGPATRATLTGPTVEPNTLFPTWKRYSYSADVPFSPERNGDYRVYVCINGDQRMDTVAVVRLPAPTVTNLAATASGHDVSLTWDDVRPLAPDLAGYRIERSLGGGGGFEPVATIGPETAAYTDTSLPAEGGDVTYQVIAIRPQVPDGAASNTASASYEPAPAGSPASGDGGTTSGGAAGGGSGGGSGGTSGGGFGVGTSASGGAGGSGRTGTRPGRSGGSGIRVPRVGTPSRNFFPALLAPPADAGFDEQLPYDPEPGDALASEELPSDSTESLPGRGLVIPMATGLVLAVWALHLRFLARAARPEYAEGIEILG